MTDTYKIIEHPFVYRYYNPYSGWGTNSNWGGYEERRIFSGNSPRVNGKLRIRANVANITKGFFRIGNTVAALYTGGQIQSAGIFNSVPYFWTSSFDDSSIKSSLSTRLATGIRVAASDLKFNLGQALAERRQTIDLVSSTALNIYKAYRDIRHGRIPRMFSHIKNIDFSKSAANIWLQYRYGWLPLLSDIAGAMTLACSRVPPWHVSRTVRDSDSKTRSYIETGDWTNTVQNDMHASMSYKMRADAWFEVSDYGRLSSFSNNLGLNNPLLLAWELLPYSFVVDWFVDIGGYLNAFNGFYGLNLIDSCVTYTKVIKTETKQKLLSVKFYSEKDINILSEGFAFGTEKRITRTLGLPVLRYPAVESKFNLTKFFTSLALLKQVFGR